MQQPKYMTLDPQKDHETIVRWMMIATWRFDIVRATEVALLKTFAIPSIAKVLADSGEFLQRTQKRYDDTDLLLSLFIENGYSSPEGRQAIVRINRMHARHPITNDQMLYVLATFVVEPILWIERFAWRPLNPLEREALFQFWINVGRLMAIKDLFTSLHEMLAFHELYERQHMAYSPANEHLYRGVLPIVSRMMPAGIGYGVGLMLPAIMSERMCRAFAIKPGGLLLRTLVRLGLKVRGWIAHFLPSRPEYRTRMRRATYPDGFAPEKLGV